MSQQSPGIRSRERAAAVPTIDGTSVDIASFVGEAKQGPINKPVYITSPDQYTLFFGAAYTGSFLAEAVSGFFANGGTRCYVTRVGHYTTISDSTTLDAVKAFATLPNSTPTNTLTIRMAWHGVEGNRYGYTCARRDTAIGTTAEATGTGARTSLLLDAAAIRKVYIGAQCNAYDGVDRIRFIVTSINGNRVGFASLTPAADVATAAIVTLESQDITIYRDGGAVATWLGLQMNAAAGALYVEALNNPDNPEMFFEFDELGVAATATVDPRPANVSTITALASGSDGSAVTDADMVGHASGLNGFYAMQGKEFNFVAAPGETSATVMSGMMAFVATRKGVQAIVEPPAAQTPTQVNTWLLTTTNLAGDAFVPYYPWLKTVDQRIGAGTLVTPPSGHAAGVWARTSRERTVAKSPAGDIDGRIQGILGVERTIELDSGDYDLIYPNGVNVIMPLAGSGICIMGDRTLGGPTERRFVNKRRTMDFFITSIRKDTRWVLFENNDEATRTKWYDAVYSFCYLQWRAGLLDGEDADDAFYIRNDANSVNTPSVIRAKKYLAIVGLRLKDSINFAEYTFEEDLRAVQAEIAGGSV